MDWEECKKEKFVKEFKAKEEFIESLKIQSNKKFETAKRTIIDETTASTKFCNFYDSIRILLEAIALKKGFKIYSHECFTSFLKEILLLEGEAVTFNRIRLIRNSINYYGEDLLPKNAEPLIEELIKLKNKLERFL